MLYVIIPVYNCEKFLETAVDSVLAQPFKDIQIVIVDDGSTDASGEIADSLQVLHDNITVLHQENQGVSAARNAGIDYVIHMDTGLDGYIAFLDADDLWAKNAVDERVAALMNSNEYDLLCFNMCHVNETLTRSDMPDKYDETPFLGGVKSVYRHPQHFGSILYSVQIFEIFNLHFFEEQSYSEDKIFRMQSLFLSQRVLRLSKVMYLYRKNESSLTHQSSLAIKYFLPIINGWLKSDYNMEEYRDHCGCELREGHTLASVYMLEMAKEHYKFFGNRKELEQVVTEHPHYPEFLKLGKNCVTPKQFAEYTLLKDHPVRFQIKYYCLGIVHMFLRAAMRFPLAIKAYERKKYPVKNEYI